MRYYVLDIQGNRFGPADISLLNEWAAQGRIAPNTVLIDESTGVQLVATQLQGLALPMHPPGFAAPMGSQAAYPPGSTPFGSAPGRAIDGSWEATTSMWLSGVSLLLCLCIPLLGIFPAIAGIVYAKGALRKGAATGSTAMVLAIGALGAQILAIIIGASMLGMFRGG